jgi:hypothetical protein
MPARIDETCSREGERETSINGQHMRATIPVGKLLMCHSRYLFGFHHFLNDLRNRTIWNTVICFTLFFFFYMFIQRKREENSN